MTTIQYSKVFSLPGYENEKIGITREIDETKEKLDIEMNKLVEQVNHIHKVNNDKRSEEQKKQNRIWEPQQEIDSLTEDLPF